MGRSRPELIAAARKGAGFVLLALGVLTVLSVNTFPAVSDDSLDYITHSQDLVDGGLVESGFRNVGYPAFIWLVRSVSNVAGTEPLLTIAILQRLLLLGLLVYTWRLWRWYVLPLAVVVVAPELLAFTNFVLIEGVGLGLALLMAVAVYQCLRPSVGSEMESGETGRWLAWFIVLCVSSAALFAMRFTFVGFLVVPVVTAFVSWRHTSRRTVVVTLAIWVLLVGGFALGLSFENQSEQGGFSPSFDSNAAEYYYAWVVVHGDPEGAPRGHLNSQREFLRVTRPEVVGPRAAAEQRHAEVVRMLDEAGIGYRSSQVESALRALTGGRFHETGNAVAWIKSTTRTNIDEPIHMNDFAISKGHLAFRNQYNDGLVPGAVITDPIGRDFAPDGRDLVFWMLPVSLLAALVGVFVRRTRWLGLVALLPMMIQAAGLGLLRADTFRYLAPTAIYTIAVATAVTFVIFETRAPGDPHESTSRIATDEPADMVSI